MSITLTPVFVDKLPLHVGKRPKVNYADSLLPLKERPLEWALLKTFSHSGNSHYTRNQLANGRYRLPPGEWEFKVVRSAYDKWEIFAKFLGEKHE